MFVFLTLTVSLLSNVALGIYVCKGFRLLPFVTCAVTNDRRRSHIKQNVAESLFSYREDPVIRPELMLSSWSGKSHEILSMQALLPVIIQNRSMSTCPQSPRESVSWCKDIRSAAVSPVWGGIPSSRSPGLVGWVSLINQGMHRTCWYKCRSCPPVPSERDNKKTRLNWVTYFSVNSVF